MAPSKLLIGGVGAAAVLGMRVARSLQARGHRPPAPAPALGEPPAPEPAQSAQVDRDVSADDVANLRGDLRRELERLAEGDVKASRSGLSSRSAG